jgi:uncharacterized membrane protein
MDENFVVSTFGEDRRAYEALARLEELAAEDQIDLHNGAVVEKVQAQLRELRERLRHRAHR